MAKDPAFLFYSNDFLSGTFTMTDEQVGKYIRLLCIQHQKGLLSEKDMLNICKTYDEDIYCKFSKDQNGNFFNIRLKEEYEKRKAYSESRRNNRKNKKIEKKQEVSKTYDEHMENENEIVIIIDYLNNKANKSFRNKTSKTKTLINARFKDGFKVDDFKKVIDNKVNDWINDPKMNEYLRPETLFGSKFESYLNKTEIIAKQNKPNFSNGFV